MTAIDAVISPFGGDARAILDAAVRAEQEGFAGVWTFDHISSLAAMTRPGEGAARDPFALLGAIAARTEHVRLGTLVANVHNRHPAQLALAMDTLASLAPGRVVCGIGAGAGPGSPFAREDAALGRLPEPAGERRRLLAEHVAALRAVWAGRDAAGSVATHGLRGVVTQPAPPIVVGGSAPAMLELAARLADGVNLVSGLGPQLPAQLARLAAAREAAELTEPFEVSVFVADRSPREARRAVENGLVPDAVARLTVLVRP